MMSPYDFMMSQIAQISDIIIRHFEVQQAFKGRRGGSIHQLRTRRWLLPSSHLTRMHKGPSVSTQCHAALIVLSDLWVVHCLSHSCVVGRLLNHTHICQFWNSGVVKRRGRGKKREKGTGCLMPASLLNGHGCGLRVFSLQWCSCFHFCTTAFRQQWFSCFHFCKWCAFQGLFSLAHRLLLAHMHAHSSKLGFVLKVVSVCCTHKKWYLVISGF